MKKIFFFVTAILLASACSNDTPEMPAPPKPIEKDTTAIDTVVKKDTISADTTKIDTTTIKNWIEFPLPTYNVDRNYYRTHGKNDKIEIETSNSVVDVYAERYSSPTHWIYRNKFYSTWIDLYVEESD